MVSSDAPELQNSDLIGNGFIFIGKSVDGSTKHSRKAGGWSSKTSTQMFKNSICLDGFSWFFVLKSGF